jgi:hypothetical protein
MSFAAGVSPDALDVETLEDTVVADNGKIFLLALSREHAIEGVAVIAR